jgi:hypothetical protein
MTVHSTNYSTLEEVWGESFSSSQKSKKEKKKKVADPICQLYEMGNNSGYTENDIVSYANDYFEKYDKTKHQKTMNEGEGVMPRARPSQHVIVSDKKNVYDTSVDDDETEDIMHEESKEKPRRSFKKNNIHTNISHHEEDTDESKPSFAFIDLLLYIVSGIILIFVMEQFVKIGLLLQ